MRAYAIGDIHGHLDLLQIAHDRIAADRAAVGDTSAPVIHIGDLVDRGPASPGVVDFLMRGIGGGEPWVVLKGNHDRMFSLWMQSPPARDHRLRAEYSWLHPRIGGADTLVAYGVRSALDRPEARVHAEALEAVPPAHLAFLAGLPALHRHGEVLFAHAGIRPGLPPEAQVEDDLIWIRHDFLDDPRNHGPLVIHGHTAVERATHYGNRVNIDSSAAYGGPVTAVVIEGREVWVLGENGREPLVP